MHFMVMEIHLKLKPKAVRTTKKRPLNPIICFAHIQFKHCKTLLVMGISQPVHSFIAYDNVVSDRPSQNKSTLIRVNNLTQNFFELVGDSAGDNLVANVAETDGSEIFQRRRIFDFWDESHDSRIPIIQGGSLIEDPQDSGSQILSNSIRSFLVLYLD